MFSFIIYASLNFWFKKLIRFNLAQFICICKQIVCKLQTLCNLQIYFQRHWFSKYRFFYSCPLWLIHFSISIIFLYKKKRCRCILSTAIFPNFIHFHQKVYMKSVWENCGHLSTALFTGFNPHSGILIYTQCNVTMCM